MRNVLRLLLLGLMLSPLLSRAQEETTIAEPEKAPFEGEISYKISYSGTGNVKAELPDSMVIAVKGRFWSVEWFGGLAEDLKTRLIYNADDSLLWLVSGTENAAFRMDPNYQAPKAKITPYREYKKVLEINTQKHILQSGESETTFWLTDSLLIQTLPDTFPHPAPLLMVSGKNEIPLRIEADGSNGKTTTMATAIRPGMIPQNRFAIPEGYDRKTFDFYAFHPLLGVK